MLMARTTVPKRRARGEVAAQWPTSLQPEDLRPWFQADVTASVAGSIGQGGAVQIKARHEQNSDTEAERIAEVLGPTLMALTASEAINYHIWETQLPAVTYLNGLFLFVAGVSILRREHRWTRRWPVMVTILGWIATLGGLFRMFAPEAQQPSESAGMYAFLGAGFVVGGVLTYKAYRHRSES